MNDETRRDATCPEEPRTGSAESASDADRECARRQAEREADRHGHAAEALDFSTFVFSLATQAFVSLGEAALPGVPAGEINPESAKQFIDVLAMLEEKTKGNLKEHEARLLANLLYDLRIRYVRLARRQTPPAAG